MVYQLRSMNGRPVTGDDGVNVQMQLLEFQERMLVFPDIGKRQITKMPFEDGAGIEYLLHIPWKESNQFDVQAARHFLLLV